MGLARLLKRLIRQPRPPEGAWKSSEGMPSSHSTNLTYYAVSIGLACGLVSWESVWALLVLAILLSWRVRFALHTSEQVAVGVCLGSIMAYTWRNSVIPSLALNSLIAQSVNKALGIQLLTAG